MDCLFCKIINGQIPCSKVFENDKVFAFLDISPLTKGHCLVIPKEHYENVFDIDKEVLQEIIWVAKNIAQKAKENLGASGVQLMNASGKTAEQSVFHFHLHVVPRYADDNLEMNNWWESKAFHPNTEELNKIAEKLSK